MINLKMIRNGLLASGASALLSAGTLAQAQQDGPAVISAPRTAVEAVALTGAGSQVIAPHLVELSVDSTTAVTVPDYTDVIVGQEKIADIDVVARHPNKVFVFGRAIGTTNIFFLDRRGDIVQQLEVHVTLDSNGAKEVIARMLPDEAIEVASFKDTIFLSGNVRSAEAARQAVTIARRFVDSDDNVKNMMTIVGSPGSASTGTRCRPPMSHSSP